VGGFSLGVKIRKAECGYSLMYGDRTKGLSS
jgi:hypothetical protein